MDLLGELLTDSTPGTQLHKIAEAAQRLYHEAITCAYAHSYEPSAVRVAVYLVSKPHARKWQTRRIEWDGSAWVWAVTLRHDKTVPIERGEAWLWVEGEKPAHRCERPRMERDEYKIPVYEWRMQPVGDKEADYLRRQTWRHQFVSLFDKPKPAKKVIMLGT